MRAAHVTAAFFSILVVVPVAWMLMDRSPPYIREGGEILPPDQIQGGFVTPIWRIKVRKACSPSTPNNVTRRITDAKGKRHFYEPVAGRFGVGVNEQIPLGLPLPLPNDIAVGRATYWSEACFACNPFQYIWPVCINTPELGFEIRPK